MIVARCFVGSETPFYLMIRSPSSGEAKMAGGWRGENIEDWIMMENDARASINMHAQRCTDAQVVQRCATIVMNRLLSRCKRAEQSGYSCSMDGFRMLDQNFGDLSQNTNL